MDPRKTGECVLELLAGIDLERAWTDEDEVAERLRAYVRALGLPAPKVRFAPDIGALRRSRRRPERDLGLWMVFTGRQSGLLDRWKPAFGEGVPDVRRLVAADSTVLDLGLGSSYEIRAVRWVAPSLARRAADLASGRVLLPPRRLEALVPLAEAAAAGLFAHCVGKRGDGDLVALLRPRMRFDEEGRLHNWDGLPAAAWPNGTGLYFWRGVDMTEHAGRDPDAVTSRRVLRWTNAERRRVAIERIGLERFLLTLGAQVIQQDDHGRLWRMERQIDGEPFVAVEVVNATEEQDGSRRTYFLRVPPSTRTARQAVAWTFGLTRKEYDPTIEA
ncbi:MAG TPA: hypothetical protein VI540_06245 [Gaiellaceae bacterium]|nr:hypothetical protein [Gaiellaceae bacterium]